MPLNFNFISKNKVIIVEIMALLVFVLYNMMFMGYLEEIFSSGSLLFGACEGIMIVGCYYVAQQILNSKRIKFSKKIIVLVIIIILGYFLFSISNLIIEYCSIIYFNYGRYQKAYEYLMTIKHPNGFNMLAAVKRVLINRNGVLSYISICWLPVSVKYIYMHYAQLQAFEKSQVDSKKLEIKLLKSGLKQEFIDAVLETIKQKLTTDNATAQSMILKLSNTTRYTLYETDTDAVLLQSELDFLLNYFDLKEAQTSDEQQVSFKLKAENIENAKIAPLMLFPFVEIAFETFGQQLRIDLSALGNELTLLIEIDEDFDPKNSELVNAKARLDVLYANKYQFNVTENKLDLLVSVS